MTVLSVNRPPGMLSALPAPAPGTDHDRPRTSRNARPRAGIPASRSSGPTTVPGGVAPAEEDDDRDQDPRDRHEQHVPGEPEERPHQGVRDEDGDDGDEDQADDALD